jgi:PAS domain S-box-containing protein
MLEVALPARSSSDDGLYLSTGQAAGRCGISRHTMLRAARRGDLVPARRTPGGDLRFRPADVDAFAARLTAGVARAGTRSRATEGALAESEARFRALTEHAGDVTRILDVDGTILYASASQTRVLGVEPEAVVGHTSFEFMDPEVVPRARATLADVVATGRMQRLISRIRHADGTYHTFEAVMQNRLDDPAVRGVVINSRDITARVEAEAALQASEERFRQVEKHAPIGLALVALDGRWLRVNPAMCALVGYAEEELLIRTTQDITHPDDVDADRDHVQSLVAGETAVRRWEKRYVRKDETEVWVLLSSSLVHDDAGQPQYVITQVQDITDRRRAERALEQARVAAEELARLRHEQAEEAEALAEVTAALSRTLEPAQLYQVILEQAARVLPCDHGSVTLYADGEATCIATWGHPRMQPGFRYPMDQRRVLAAGGLVSHRADADEDPGWHALPPLVGPYRERSIIVSPLTIEGVLVGSFDVSSRIPRFYTARHVRIAGAFAERATHALRNARLYQLEQERATAAQKLAHMQSDFVARVSHELRTPLTAIVGFGELLQAHWEGFSEERRLARIDQIVMAANRQLRLVEDLLLVSRLEVASLAIQLVATPVANILRQVAAELQASFPGQQVILEGPVDLWVWADASRTAQVLTNLLDNAAKYSPEGSAITVTWRFEGAQGVMRVRDHGSGIPESGREQLFTRFGRVVGSRIRAGHVGTGLGLFISRGLAEAMGGDLDLEESGQHGSTFRLRLPVVTAEQVLDMHQRRGPDVAPDRSNV